MNESGQYHSKQIFREIEFWILALATILFFYRPLFFGETFFFRDLYNHFYPQKRLLVELIQNGEIPLWDPYRHGGQPFLGNMNNAVLYPMNVLYLILPLDTAFNLDIVIHFLFAAAGAYLLARHLTFSKTASMVTAFVFTFSGPTLSIPNVWLYAPCHLVFMLFFWHRFLTEEKWKWFLLTAVMGIVQLFAGRPELPSITLILLLGWTLFFPANQKRIARKLAVWTALCLTIILGAAIQLIPMAEIVSNSSRTSGADFRTFSAWSVHPKRLPELILSQFFGITYRLSTDGYWGFRFEDLGSPYLISIYFGLPALFLAAWGGLSSVETSSLPLKTRRFLIVVAVISIIFSLGRFLPFFEGFFQSFPPIRVFRYPVKSVVIAILPIALLAGFQFDSLFRSQSLKTRFSVLIVFAIAAILIVLTSISALNQPVVERILNHYFHNSGPNIRSGITSSLIYATISWFLISILIWRSGNAVPPLFRYLFVALIAADLLNAGAPVNHFAPREFFTNVPELVQQVRKEIGDGKLHRSGDKASLKYHVPADDIIYADRWHMEMLSNYLGSLYSIPVVFHEDYDRLEWIEMEKLSEAIRHTIWEGKLPALTAADVRIIISNEQIKANGLTLISVIRNKSNTPYFLYRNDRCPGRVRFIHSSESITLHSDVLKTITDPEFNPCNSAIIDRAVVAGQRSTNAAISTESAASTKIIYRIKTDMEGYAVFSDPAYPGWTIKINGQQTEFIRANAAFWALRLKQGDYLIQREYFPASFLYGIILSTATLILLVGGCYCLDRKNAAAAKASF